MRGVLYLEGDRAYSAAELELGQSVAARIAQLLHSAELVSELSRRTRNLELLEALGKCLTAGELAPRHLAQTVDAALGATDSDEPVWIQLSSDMAAADAFAAAGLSRDHMYSDAFEYAKDSKQASTEA